jgi:type I restriction enzyme M protein
MSISTLIKSIQDNMRQDPGVDGDAQRLSQLTWMLFLKVFDDREAERELFDDGYRSPIPDRFRWRKWAREPELSGNTLIGFVNQDLFKTLKELPTGGKNAALAGVVRGVFEDAINYMKSGVRMRQVLNALDQIDFNRAADRHQLGDIYEQLLGELPDAGSAGEYYTPRAVTRFIVDRVDPRLGEKVLDPACGTGGFLIRALEHVREKYVRKPEDEERLQQDILGIEKKQVPHLLCVTNMLLHGSDVPSTIRRGNALARSLRDYGSEDRVRVIITNPPFGGVEVDGLENNFPQEYRTRETADLFLLLIMTLLEDGGRAAMVFSDGMLFGKGVKTSLKEKLLEECDLHTIVRLPAGVFNPYTSIKTNLLFFTKGRSTKEVWFYEHPSPHGDKGYSKTRPMRFEEFEPERKWWSERKETEHAWKVSLQEIQARDYNLDFKNPRKAEQGSAPSPSVLRSSKERPQGPLFSWVHLSDIHIGHGGASHQWDQRLVLAALRRDIAELAQQPDFPRPDAILVTGDIAFSGQREQYEVAKVWLLDVAKAVGLERRHVFTVPGNHDVQRAVDKNRNIFRMMRALRDGTDDLDDALKDETDRAQLIQRMEEYLKFASDFAPSCLHPGGAAPAELSWIHLLSARSGLNIRLLGLNTALLSADTHDKGKLRLGKEALGRAFSNAVPKDDELVLVLSHHPFRDGWLADQREAETWIRGRAHIHLSGHVHQSELEESRSGSGSNALLRIVAGAVHGEKLPADIPASHGYNFAAVYPAQDGELVLRVWPRLWSDNNKDFRLDIHHVPPRREYAEHRLLNVRLPSMP